MFFIRMRFWIWTAVDKKIKTAIINKIFKTTSKTEIEKMDHAALNFRRQELNELFQELNQNQPEDLLLFIDNYDLMNVA